MAGAVVPFTVEELSAATDGFAAARLVGEGGSGEVFNGVLETGQVVAVKRWRGGSVPLQDVGELMNEVTILSRVAHVNVLPVTGFAVEPPALMLVTPYMPRGSLHAALHRGERGAVLDAAWRVTFLAGLAHGIRALHEAWSGLADICSPPHPNCFVPSFRE